MNAAPRTVRRSLPWLLAALSMIGPFSIDAVFPAFPSIGARFGVDDAALQQLISVYLITYAAMSLFHGAISDAIGRKPVMIFGVAPVIAPMVRALLLPLGGWHGIFWVLTGFTAVLALVLWWLLDETHPREQRTSFAPRHLLSSYASFGRDRVFWPLLVSSSVNFAGLFLYISSAPRIVRQLLHLSAQGFPWLFIPVVAGLVGGAWCSGRMAERTSVRFTVNTGYAAMALACVLHLALALVFPSARLPWSMLPLILHGVGVQLAFPTLTLLLLDRFPHRRGGISSVQAFASLLRCSVVAGVLSPLLSASMLGLALGASALTAVGALAWWRYQVLSRRPWEQGLPNTDPGTVIQAEIAEPH